MFDPKQCKNDRTIALVSHTSETLLWIILIRRRCKTESEIADEQSRFSRRQETREQNINVRIIMTNQPVFILRALINLRKS